MTLSEKEMLSVQEFCQMVERAHAAQRIWGISTQQQVDKVCKDTAQAAFLGAELLGRMTTEETGFGVPEQKKLKNEFASRHLGERIKDIKTVGLVNKDNKNMIYEIVWPMGVVAALTPSTIPTSSTMN